MRDAGLTTSTTLFLGTRQDISSAGRLEQQRIVPIENRDAHARPNLQVGGVIE